VRSYVNENLMDGIEAQKRGTRLLKGAGIDKRKEMKINSLSCSWSLWAVIDGKSGVKAKLGSRSSDK
jgi:hypothetical protein